MFQRYIGIVSATIQHLNEPYYFLKRNNYWVLEIMLENLPASISLDNICQLNIGATKRDASENYSRILKFFYSSGIINGSSVNVIFDKKGIIAISKSGEDYWLHVRGGLKAKTFSKLGITNPTIIVASDS